MSKNLVTPEFRASFVHLTKPRSGDPNNPDGEKKYSLSVVLEMDNPAHAKFLKELEKVVDATAKDKFGGKLPKKLKRPFRDGDEEENRPELAGCVFFSCSAKEEFRPDIVDADLQAVIDPKELYSGMYCRVSLRPYAWDHPTGGKGVSLGLGNVQKTKDGEPLSGGGVKAESEFKAWDEE